MFVFYSMLTHANSMNYFSSCFAYVCFCDFMGMVAIAIFIWMNYIRGKKRGEVGGVEAWRAEDRSCRGKEKLVERIGGVRRGMITCSSYKWQGEESTDNWSSLSECYPIMQQGDWTMNIARDKRGDKSLIGKYTRLYKRNLWHWT